jgi:hypothetical protein
MPDGVVGVEAVGKVTADDYESVLMPAVEAAVERAGKARTLLLFGSEFDGYEAEAALDDMKMGLHTWGDFERIAFVSDQSGYRTMVKAMGFLMPGEVRVFGVGELEEAKEWVGA